MSLFNENMTTEEAWKVLFTVTEGKTKEEREEIMQEYEKVLPALIKRELDVPDGMLTSYNV